MLKIQCFLCVCSAFWNWCLSICICLCPLFLGDIFFVISSQLSCVAGFVRSPTWKEKVEEAKAEVKAETMSMSSLGRG